MSNRLVRFPSHDGFRRMNPRTGAMLPGRWHLRSPGIPAWGVPRQYERGWTAKRAIGKSFLAQKRWRDRVGNQERAQLGRLKRNMAARKIGKAFKSFKKRRF